MEMARQLATVAGEQHGIRPLLIAKIERAEAIPVLKEILEAADGIMVARGDLAVEVGNAAVPALQKRMIRMAREPNKLAITATQMMESMIVNAGADPRRGQRRRQCRSRRHRRGDAVGRNGQRQVSGRDGRDDGARSASKPSVRRRGARPAIPQPQTFTRVDQSIAMAALFTAHHLAARRSSR